MKKNPTLLPPIVQLSKNSGKVLYFLVLFYLKAELLSAQGSSKDDIFANIAGQSIEITRDNLFENKPAILPNRNLECKVSNPKINIGSYSKMETKEDFKKGLEQLRKKYTPFLKNYTPASPSTRAKKELKQWNFRFEAKEDQKDFNNILQGKDAWEKINIPHYTGPIGWWTAYYKTKLELPEEVMAQDRIFVMFGAVDYKAEVFINNIFVGSHQGFFAPFEIDITPYIQKGKENWIVVKIKNEAGMLGLKPWGGPDIDGDKIYGGTGLGWNTAGDGWHHSPPGAGIWQKVFIEGRPRANINDVYMRPDIDNGFIEARISVYESENISEEIELNCSIYSKNFSGQSWENIPVKVQPLGPGLNEYKAFIRLENFRLWELENPFLYTFRAEIKSSNGKKDIKDITFGMRKFVMDESSPVKGTLFLNNKQIFLRGANTMGHEQLAVMNENWDQLIDDILIAKMANINYYRFTQRPVQPEVYEYCDMLGILNQTDLPLFGYLRRTQLEEALRQTGEMTKLIRTHPSNIMVSFINEPYNSSFGDKRHRHFSRNELERFFTAAAEVVKIYHPDQVIKPADGDYDGPAPFGLPDNHCYSGWYGFGGLPLGQLYKGFWLPSKKGWKLGCGEYGAEGLEDEQIMFKYYPSHWLHEKKDTNAIWNPGLMTGPGHKAQQTYSMHHQWFEEKATMKEWIQASQKHQAWATRLMTRAFRRQSDRIVSSAIHLLIDAYPAGWMKTIVDVERNPKPAYFEYKDALTPLMTDIRTDRQHYFGGENLKLEFWLYNDKGAPFPKGSFIYEVWMDNKKIFSQNAETDIPSYGPYFVGNFNFKTPEVSKRNELLIRVGLKDEKGKLWHVTEERTEVFPNPTPNNFPVFIVGKKSGRGWVMAEKLGLSPTLFSESNPTAPIIIDNIGSYEMVKNKIDSMVAKGATAFVLEQPEGTYQFANSQITIFDTNPKYFVSRKTGHPIIKDAKEMDFSFWYNEEKDYIDYLSYTAIEAKDLKPILLTGQTKPKPDHIFFPVAAEMTHGEGSFILNQLRIDSKLETEPALQNFLVNILKYKNE